MNQTIVGIFDSEHEVQPLIQDLSTLGISREQIDVVDNQRSFDSTDMDDRSEKRKSSGLRRWLEDFGLAGKEPDYMAESVRRGSVLVTVNADDNKMDQVSDMMCQHGAIDIDQRAQYYQQSGFTEYDDTAPNYTREETIAERERFQPGGQFAIPVIEENVNVGKQKYNTGRVRIISRVTERPIDQQVSLREERVDVERRPVDRALNTNDLDAFKEGEIELTETAERLRVDKEARVVEEVMVRQNADTHTEEVHETARRRDVEVERDHDSMDTDTSMNMNRTSDRDDLRPHR